MQASDAGKQAIFGIDFLGYSLSSCSNFFPEIHIERIMGWLCNYHKRREMDKVSRHYACLHWIRHLAHAVKWKTPTL